ncbi:MAG TPA: amidohydrolase family protein [Ginsengibacter sp.]|mgnify:CR=1 FL=1|nr:amidohydrolase family protein [Chitinophagaceae bacterium]MCZ2395147.1 amidohydrolase family protein [Chitinophagales bacterium]HRN72454.1 amidohydrolase family protein [Ginsengibacter sp.]HRP17226.1 amidohydrolase family protein [Ginsengibacter sp.]
MKYLFSLLLPIISASAFAQTDSFYLLKPSRVFDGEILHDNWVVLVKGNKIIEAGTISFKLPSNTRIIELKGATLLPGLIEGHSHLYLHPYNETSWNDQVLKESRAERTARAVTHAEATLMAGFTTIRELGTEGAAYDDAGLKMAIEKGVISGPRMIVATKAIVAKGSYGVKSDNPDVEYPKGAAEVANREEMEREVRSQISKGADVIKIYADYRWNLQGEAAPTFSVDELAAAVAIAESSGRYVAVHSATTEGMLRSIKAGVHTIEHGDLGTEEIFKAMKEKNIAYCPTLAASDAITQYNGWKKGTEPEPLRILNKRKSFSAALRSGVTILMGGDVGVFPHGDNAREMEMMVDYGMPPIDVLKSATSVNADVFGWGDRIGRIRKGLFADLIAVSGNPSANIHDIRKTIFIMKDGTLYMEPKR